MLGLTGAGGSILTVPLLLYIGHFPLKQAIAISFFVVALSSLVALTFHIRNKTVDWKLAVVFGFPAMLGAFVGGSNAEHLPDNLILSIFYFLMLVSGFKLAVSEAIHNETYELKWTLSTYCTLSLSGLMIGLLTGLIGVGGGFLVVPALLILAKTTSVTAIGTSLCIVVGQASFGLAGYAQHTPFDLKYASILAILCSAGSLAGGKLSGNIKNSNFKLGFGWFLLLFATVFGTVELLNGFGHHFNDMSALRLVLLAITELGVIVGIYKVLQAI